MHCQSLIACCRKRLSLHPRCLSILDHITHPRNTIHEFTPTPSTIVIVTGDLGPQSLTLHVHGFNCLEWEFIYRAASDLYTLEGNDTPRTQYPSRFHSPIIWGRPGVPMPGLLFVHPQSEFHWIGSFSRTGFVSPPLCCPVPNFGKERSRRLLCAQVRASFRAYRCSIKCGHFPNWRTR